jgi:alginate O-acetyltransferase complex protein AlgI
MSCSSNPEEQGDALVGEHDAQSGVRLGGACVSMTSPAFMLCFVPLALAGAVALKRVRAPRATVAWLVAASFLFCLWADPRSLLPLALSMFFNYAWGAALVRTEPSRHVLRKALLVLGVLANLGLLACYKFSPPSLDLGAWLYGHSTGASPGEIPLGISFLTFLQLGFLADLYGGRTRLRGLADYCLFVAFFPKLTAGPIVRPQEFADGASSLASERISRTHLAEGVTLVVIGLFKKLALADGLAPHANAVFASAAMGGSLSLLEAWGGVLAYTFQIYFDFSGYSDMAIGVARLFGITLPWNFNSPYKATSISDYWKRWHITLSAFLRDYIYLPLGGKGKGTGRQYLNLWITMTLCGLWHGARWGFVAWGMLHGLFLVTNHAWRKRGFSCSAPVGWALTFLGACLARVWFRADDLETGVEVFRALVGANGLMPVGAVTGGLLKALSTCQPAAQYATVAHVVSALGGSFSLGRVTLHPAEILLSDVSLKLVYLAVAAFVAFALPNSQEFAGAAVGREGSPWSARRAVGIALLAYLAMLASITSPEATAFVYRRF